MSAGERACAWLLWRGGALAVDPGVCGEKEPCSCLWALADEMASTDSRNGWKRRRRHVDGRGGSGLSSVSLLVLRTS